MNFTRWGIAIFWLLRNLFITYPLSIIHLSLLLLVRSELQIIRRKKKETGSINVNGNIEAARVAER